MNRRKAFFSLIFPCRPSPGLLERPQIGALEVLDQRALERGALLDILDDDRDLV